MATTIYCRRLLTERVIHEEKQETTCYGSKKGLKLFPFFDEPDFVDVSLLVDSAVVEIINNEGNYTETSSETTESKKKKNKKTSFWSNPQLPMREVISFSRIVSIAKNSVSELEKPVITLEIEKSKDILFQIATDEEAEEILELLKNSLIRWRTVEEHFELSNLKKDRFQQLLNEGFSLVQLSCKDTQSILFHSVGDKEVPESIVFSTKAPIQNLHVVWNVMFPLRNELFSDNFEILEGQESQEVSKQFMFAGRQCDLSFLLKCSSNGDQIREKKSVRKQGISKELIIAGWALLVVNYFLQAEFNTWQAPHNICFQVGVSSLLIVVALAFSQFFGKTNSPIVAVVPRANYDYTLSNLVVNAVEDTEVVAKQKKIEEMRGIEGLLEAISQEYNGKTTAKDLPFNWIEGCDFDRKDALARWNESLKWRKENNIDAILQEGTEGLTQEACFNLKKIWNQSFLNIGKDDKLITLERFKGLDKICKEMKKKGIQPETFRDYCIFQNEFWIKNKLSPAGKLIKIIDVEGLTVGLSLSIILRYFGKMNKAMQQYPEIMSETYFVNVEKSGTAFRLLFKMLPNFLDPRTMKKLKQIKLDDPEAVETLRKVVGDPTKLPKDLGGEYEGDVYDLPMELELKEHIKKVLK